MAAERRAELLIQTVTLETYQQLVDKKEQSKTPDAQPSTIFFWEVHVSCTRDFTGGPTQRPSIFPCKGAKGKLQRGREGACRPTQQYQHSITHCGQIRARSNNSAAVPKSGPQEIVLVLKCKMLTLSLVEPIFEKHKVLFILTFFFFIPQETKQNFYYSRCFPCHSRKYSKVWTGHFNWRFFFSFRFCR